MTFLGVDVGTTGAKALAVDENGCVLGRGYHGYDLSFPHPGQVEQNAEDWWQAVIASVRQALSAVADTRAVVSLGLSAQGASMLAVDAQGCPLGPAITWMDTRAERECEALMAAVGADAVYTKTGWPASPTLDAAKIAWLQRHQPEAYRQASLFVSTMEFINARLTGQWTLDITAAAIRQLADIQTMQWDKDILGFLELDESRLPSIRPCGTCLGPLIPAAAEALGLPQTVLVYNGAHDQYCAAMGSGVHSADELLLATGTTWVTLGITGQPCYTPSRLSPCPFPFTKGYGVMASMVSAGSALKWWKGISGQEYAVMDAAAAGRRMSAEGLLFYPYLAGGGVLHPPGRQGSITGMTLRHDAYDLALALMEGVAFETRLLLEEFAGQGIKPETLVMTGGGARSRLWSEIVGYVTGRAIVLTGEPDSACLGAAMTAAAGQSADFHDNAKRFVRRQTLPLPEHGQHAFYEEKYRRYTAGLASPSR